MLCKPLVVAQKRSIKNNTKAESDFYLSMGIARSLGILLPHPHPSSGVDTVDGR